MKKSKKFFKTERTPESGVLWKKRVERLEGTQVKIGNDE